MKKRIKQLALTVLGIYMAYLISFLFLKEWSSIRQYQIPFEEAESQLFEALSLVKEQVLNDTRSSQAKAGGKLAKPMSMKLYAIELHSYIPNEHLSFTASHGYNIGASGSESILFDLRANDSDETKVSVNYTDQWIGIFPPFAFANHGPLRERKIHKLIWKE